MWWPSTSRDDAVREWSQMPGNPQIAAKAIRRWTPAERMTNGLPTDHADWEGYMLTMNADQPEKYNELVKVNVAIRRTLRISEV